ncbi:hypothetical protein FZEAL_4866 [Fusarium zealandicum]|uniref:ATP-dependent DNA helicase PIF1 n=1 Tax=Fusarium zealandicum TaxID=1053134 RepID=A0A8H4XL08_9HYPO|nr:hypothetical protein FZEAL_4866 [Fusarium zealandicum]
MTAGIVSLPIRSSPTRGYFLRRAVQQLAHAHTQGASASPIFNAMLARANSEFEANGPPPQRSQPSKPFLPSSSPTRHNADIRQQLKKPNAAAVSARTMQPFSNPLNNRPPDNMNQSASSRPAGGVRSGSLASLYGASNSFRQDPAVIDLTGSLAKAKAAIDFSENDLSDDDDLDLDFKAPSALPTLPKPATSTPISNENMPPPPTSEKPFDWSSSPVSHFLPPQRTTSVTSTVADRSLKRESSGDRDSMDPPAPKKAKKRVLPQSFKQEEPEDDDEDHAQIARTPAAKRKDFWNPTASAVKEQKKQFRNQRQQEQPTPNTEMSTDDVKEVAKSHAKGNFAISLSEEQRHVLDLVVNQGQSVFFTGAAGTGKSVLMRAIITELKKKHAKDPERVAVTASTGLAACNIGGITLHSFSGIGLGKEDAPTLIKKIRRNPKAKNRWLKTKCLVLDEVSMVDGDLFDKLSQIGRTIRNNGRPWGGIQLVITGDFFQLPPVPDHGSKRETKFAFDAATWTTSIDHTIGLTQVFRQRDPKFANMLNEMRLGRISEDTVRAFKALARPLNYNDGMGTAELFSTRNEVENSNEKRLRELPGTTRRYDALDTGKEEVKDKLLMNMMAPKSINLKMNTQVMLIKNLDESLVNGSLGKVIGFSDEKTFDMTPADDYDEDDSMAKARRKLMKSFSRDPDTSSSGVKFPVVQFMATDGTSRVILCQPEEWKVELPNGELQAKRTQLPLILAWALSIHKAQGQTLERVKVNLGRVFEKGQAYVALSRATTQDGLQVLGFEKSKVMAHPRVIDFYNKLYSAEDALGRRPQTINDFVSNRIGPAAPKKPAQQVVELDDEEEAMASFEGWWATFWEVGTSANPVTQHRIPKIQSPTLTENLLCEKARPLQLEYSYLGRLETVRLWSTKTPKRRHRPSFSPIRPTFEELLPFLHRQLAIDDRSLARPSSPKPQRNFRKNPQNPQSPISDTSRLRLALFRNLMTSIRDVQAGSGLTLTNVFVSGTKEWHPQMRIDAANIADLSEIKTDDAPATYAPPPAEPVAAPTFSQPPSQPSFVDPAILSLGRPPASATPADSGAKAIDPKDEIPELQAAQPSAAVSTPGRFTPDQDLTGSIVDLAGSGILPELGNGHSAEPREGQSAKKKNRRSRQPKQAKGQRNEDSGQPAESSPAGSRGKGWRQTPILQSTSSFQPFHSLKRNGKGRKGTADNGWASEEVTEEMGDFDFENNLAKFDKRTIFDQMRKEDQIDDANRLVSHNRRPKPGTAGGKNLHPTENVLDIPSTAGKNADFWNSEADDGLNGAERPTARDLWSGQSNRRADSKSGPARRSQSRKASAVVTPGGLPMSRVNSGVRASHFSRLSISRPESRSTDGRKQQGHPPGLYLVPSGKRLETVSALQMLNLENIAANEVGLSEALMAENAGRGIAEVAFKALSDPATKMRFGLVGANLSASAILSNPAVVILAGNNKSGIRAIAAGRHLRNKNVNLLVCLVGIERERDLLEDLRQQLQLYRAFGGKILSKTDLFEHLRKNSSSGSPVSISLIIDALLGLTISFEELRTGDQATVYELMEWANRNEAFVLSVDVPTGIDPTSGKVAVIDGNRLFVKPRYVVAMGAPKRGLVEAVTPPGEHDPEYLNSSGHEDEWRLYIADIGLGSAVWRKAGTKIRRGIAFDERWVLEMRYRDGQQEETDYEEE